MNGSPFDSPYIYLAGVVMLIFWAWVVDWMLEVRRLLREQNSDNKEIIKALKDLSGKV